MLVALYHGTSWMSRGIKWITRSEVSHAAFVLDGKSAEAAKRTVLRNLKFKNAGAVVEAWEPGGVRNTENISGEGHAAGTQVDLYEFVMPLSMEEDRELLLFLDKQIGMAYDFRNVFRFLPIVRLLRSRERAREKGWFCSELVTFACEAIRRLLFRDTKAECVPPDWIPRSLAIRFVRTERTV